MPSKYLILKPDELIKILKQYNFDFISQKGSHMKYSDGKHIVIIPNHYEIAKGTLKSILDMAEIDIDEFRKYL